MREEEIEATIAGAENFWASGDKQRGLFSAEEAARLLDNTDLPDDKVKSFMKRIDAIILHAKKAGLLQMISRRTESVVRQGLHSMLESTTPWFQHFQEKK